MFLLFMGKTDFFQYTMRLENYEKIIINASTNICLELLDVVLLC
jgi:hypothetical protein